MRGTVAVIEKMIYQKYPEMTSKTYIDGTQSIIDMDFNCFHYSSIKALMTIEKKQIVLF